MLLIINLGIIFSLLIIVLFNIVDWRQQFIITLGILIILLLFKLICDKLIKHNKNNVDYRDIYKTKNNLISSTEKINKNNQNNKNKNIFDLKNIDRIMMDMKNIRNQDAQCDKINVNNKTDMFSKDSGNGEFHYKDLHNKIINSRLNTSDKQSLLLNNVDCLNDNSCIIEPTIYNLHRY